jgi:eukaryotic-like serine/threonine-protein kinase
MTDPHLKNVEEIFYAALECEPGQINRFLKERCAGNEDLRREVEALLALHRQAGSFIETPIADVAAGLLKQDETDLLIGQTIGHYKISERISAGGMGEVYLATDTIVGRKAALKFLHARFTGDAMRLKRFQQEARVVAGLNHPNILTIYQVGEDAAVQYIASELIEGETLRQRLARGRIPLNEAVDIAIQVAGALAAAHSAGIVHRDVKPENIMLRPDGYVKVLDFGIAKLAEQEVPVTMPQEEALLLVETNLGSVLGTVRYMSPEQARGAPVDKRGDIWSLGIVLYEMALGHTPFAGDTPREVMTAILKAEPRPLRSYSAQIPGELEPIVSKALQKDPGQRYQNASEMLGELKALRRRLEFAAEVAKSAPEKSIAVLPFENLSADKANAYFADGIQEEILTRLSRIGDLKVISRTSTQRFRDTTEPVREIAKQLGVATILEGSVSKAGETVRVHVQLIDAESDMHVWAEHYDRELVDIFAVETDIAENIANALKAKLTRAERRAITSRPTKNLEAYQLCLKARHQWKNFYAPGYEKVREYFEQAVALDPSYAVAQTGLSDYYAFGAANGLLPPKECWPRAEEGLRKSLALDDTLADSYHLLAAVELHYKRNWPAAERAFLHAAELDPNLADIPHHYALCLALFGRNDEALAQMDRAALLDPFFPGLSLHRGLISFFLRDYDRAIKHYTETLEMYPDYAVAHEYFGDAYEKKGMLHETITQWSAALTLRGKPEHARMLEEVFNASGFQAAVRTLAERQLQDLDRKRAQGNYVAAADYVFTNVRRGSIDGAFEWLPKMVEERNWFALQLRVNPILDPLRGDPRFEALVQKIFANN